MNLISAASRVARVERAGAHWQMAAAYVALLAAVVGCNPSQALQVQEPDNVPAGSITSAAGLPSVRNAVLSAMQIAYSGGADLSNGGHEGEINISGLLSDEMEDVETFTTRIQIDGRVALPGNQTLNGISSISPRPGRSPIRPTRITTSTHQTMTTILWYSVTAATRTSSSPKIGVRVFLSARSAQVV